MRQAQRCGQLATPWLFQTQCIGKPCWHFAVPRILRLSKGFTPVGMPRSILSSGSMQIGSMHDSCGEGWPRWEAAAFAREMCGKGYDGKPLELEAFSAETWAQLVKPLL